MPRNTPKKTPQQIAREAVEEWHSTVIEDRDALYTSSHAASTSSRRIDSAFDAIENFLEAEHVKGHGPIEPDDDLQRVMFGRDAGYLIGVQVGLRLRGGAR